MTLNPVQAGADLEAYAFLHDCTPCGVFDWGLQVLIPDKTTWDMVEQKTREDGKVGILVTNSKHNQVFFEAEKGISGVYECLANGMVVKSNKALTNIAERDHVHIVESESAQKTEEVGERRFQGLENQAK